MKANRSEVSWALYDWANSAFAATVMSALFPPFFKNYWCEGVDVVQSTAYLGFANSLGSFILAFLAPILGAIADQGSAKKKFLLTFAFLGIVMTGCLFMIEKGNWQMAAFIYVLASLGFAGGNIFYDSLLLSVTTPNRLHRISGLGYSLGYLGGGLLLVVNVLMVLKPETFGFADKAEAVKTAFLSVSVWWAIFTIPIWLFVHEEGEDQKKSHMEAILLGFSQLLGVMSKLKTNRNLLIFLGAYFFYIDGVHTIIRMAVDYGMSIGFQMNDLITALIITQCVGFPSAIILSRIGERIGSKLGISIGICIYLVATVWGFFMTDPTEFYALAGIIGLVQGGVQALSRSLYALMIPEKEAGEFFGFYNMFGKFSAVMGPMLMAGVGLLTGDPRYSILSIVVLFLIGGTLLYFVKEPTLD